MDRITNDELQIKSEPWGDSFSARYTLFYALYYDEGLTLNIAS